MEDTLDTAILYAVGTSIFQPLQESQSAEDLIRSHDAVVQYHEASRAKIEECFKALRGDIWSDKEKELFRIKKKTPIVLNNLKPSERTILGLFIKNKYDVKFSPFEPTDQDITDVLVQLYLSTSNGQGWKEKDVEIFRQAWAGGVAYQDCYVDYKPGKEPRIRTANQNVFVISWDPDSRELITREDAEFVDREGWYPFEQLKAKFPDILLDTDNPLESLDGSYQTVEAYRDRTSQYLDTRNGKIKVIERYYRAREWAYYAILPDGNKMVLERKDVDAFKVDYPDAKIFADEMEFLNLAVTAPAVNKTKYLFNDRYHCQPRDPDTDKIIFPILEMVAESLNGDPSGFVEHEIMANKILSGIMSNIYHGIKHSASTSYFADRSRFRDEAEYRRFTKNHADGDQVFDAKELALGPPASEVPKATVSNDHDKLFAYLKQHLDEVSATPPALQGQQEAAGTPGVLNAQRIEQAVTQLLILVHNWRSFLKQRAKLVYAYWREYYTYEMKFRVVEKKNPEDPLWITLNQEVPAKDPNGNLTGAIEKINDITAARHDVVIEESNQSPTYRMKNLQVLAEYMQNPAVQQDPELFAILSLHFADMTDMPQTLKQEIKAHSTVLKQQQAQAQQVQQQQSDLDMQAKTQEVAQREAEQTFIPPGTPQGAPAPSPNQPVPA